MRLRTLPLACAGIIAGSMLAWQQERFQASLFSAALICALLLQIFSNLANDYGDALHGADTHRPDAPLRTVAAGLISPAHMLKAMLICALLCIMSGLGLLLLALPGLSGLLAQWWLWLSLGSICLAAAWAYTAGARPYGYAGLGDMAVWLFFGWVAVLGSAALQGTLTDHTSAAVANALGLWCAAVLNINNMRDIDTDIAAGKHTIAARLGHNGARIYHVVLLLLATASWWVWLRTYLPAWLSWLLMILAWSFYAYHGRALWRARQAIHRSHYNQQLAQLSLFILGWVLLNWLLLWRHG